MGEGHSHHSLGYSQLSFLHHHHHHNQQQQEQPPPPPQPPPRSRYGGGRAKGSAMGEIVEVQGGHIVRSTGRKDRHSKVCTAKGPRDRRVRLAAHTAIQFYDVQDRLGYDRPSKAVDWLIKNARAAIDQLAELPAWTPIAASASGATPSAGHSPAAAEQPSEESGKKQILVDEPAVTAAFSFDGSDGSGDGSGGNSFLPPSMDNNAIADTIKSFFPIAAAAAAANSTSPSSSPPPVGYQSYPPPLLSRNGSLTQDLRLSLQSFQDPIFHHSQAGHHQYHHQNTPTSAHNSLLDGSARLSFDAASACWAEQNRQMASWSMAEPGGGGGGLGEFAFAIPPPPQPVPAGPSQFFSQRGTLQSSNSPSVRGWAEPDAELQMQPVLHPSLSPIGYASEAGFSGFCIPARIQGVEEHGGISNKLPSASSASRH